ncbi:class I SAM-dependent methyltransferase [Paenibacillus thermotolerans]|uniref:class I SAM-dependent methyltransferase n=1 Tax=Paenibacillus thermotolerans TaxID=3027807 RepID=UPI0023686AD5|nr:MULTISPECIES: class I SAM-dependent methyltransferase [unclassified Paenibacillus]
MIHYDGFAEQYDAMVKQGGPRKVYGYIIHELSLETELKDKTICDLGCGQGELAHALSQRGAYLTGVDYSKALLSLAKSLTGEVNWIHDDAMTLQSIPDESFDIVTSSVMLMDVPDHHAVFNQSYRILKSGGIMIWIVMHPCFQSPFSHPLEDGARKVYQYAPQFWKSHGSGTLRSTLGAYHRSVAQYLNDFMKTGFELKRVLEPGYETAYHSVISHFGALGYKK